ncbi:MAG TPA: MBL fold metallo-hydrolase [Blastocatellia bacterium]|nr:MBL fold metallo-hydrolase [Blastocatellia bacterium]
MKIRWVNHASFVLEFGDVKLISDPWLEGTAFNDGWALLSPTAFRYEDFADITHIWFSHEHPDHFAPHVLKKIPVDYRRNITVLYQRTVDRKVAEFCRTLQFKEVLELYPDSYLKIGDGISLLCEKIRNESDSWLFIKTPEFTILNLNDCYFRRESEPVKIKQKIGKVDLLLCQFSYANWCGNKDRGQERKEAAGEKLNEMLMQAAVFQPRFVIPFASFVWFCNQDNYFMNYEVNRIGEAYNRLRAIQQVEPIVLYPGFEWEIEHEYARSDEAIDLYQKDYEKVFDNPAIVASPSKELAELKAAAEAYRSRCLQKNDRLKLLSLAPFTCYLTDLRMSFSFSYRDGLVQCECGPEDADLSLGSQALHYCFNFDWGFATLEVSGRFEKPPKGDYNNVSQYLWVSELMNRGKYVPGRYHRGLTKLRQALRLE